jgi:hypothetical protein
MIAVMIEIFHQDLELALSLERFGRYLDWAGGDRQRAIELYTLNTRISESLYIPLQTLEVALRNRVHTVMKDVHGETWFQTDIVLGDRQPDQLRKAIKDIEDEGREATPGRIVAALTFGFWTAMLGKEYEDLWQETLNAIAKKPNGKGLRRKGLSAPLTPIRVLRNRIAHHEPILMWDLAKHHDKIIELITWLSPPAAAWCSSIDRFQEVYPAQRIELATVEAVEVVE